MKVLFISRLDGEEWQGPTHSVPKQVLYQKRYDDVRWININGITKSDWEETGVFSTSLSNLHFSIKEITDEFYPEIIVFEGVYEHAFLKLVYECWTNNIPYVVVPRSALTLEGQNNKRLKKIIGNMLFFGRFIRRAKAIQFLTIDEKKDSLIYKEKQAYIIPNGIEKRETQIKRNRTKEKIIINYIGRVEIYQKGLDILIEACAKVRQELVDNHVEINIFGPDRDDSKSKMKTMIKKNNLEKIILLHEAVFGDEKKEILLQSDVFIMTSRCEGLSMGLIEALAYGIPCLITKGTNLKDEVEKFDAGWTADNNIDSVSEMLSTFLEQLSRINEKGENALILSQQYEWDSIAKKTHEMFERIVRLDI